MRLPRLPLAPSSALVLAIGLGLAISCLVGLEWLHERERNTRFEALASQAVHQVIAKIKLFEYGLRGARGAVVAASAGQITRARFHDYMLTRDVEREFAGAHGFGFIRRVRREDELAYLRRVRADGAPDFRLHQFSDHPGDRWVIEYLEPEEPNREALGLDIASEPRRAAALSFAVRSSSAALTAPVSLLQAKHQALSGFLLVLPVYRLPVPPVSVAERERLALGLTYAPILISEVMADFDFDAGSFGLRIADVGADGREERFYESSASVQEPESSLSALRMTPVYGRTWKIEVFARPAFLSRLNQTSALLVASLVFLIAMLCALIVELRVRSGERRRLGLEERLRLAAIVDSSRDAIVGLGLDGRVMSWNPGAERMFGYPAQQVQGKRIDELIVPESRRHEIRSMLARIARAESAELPETERLRCDGSRVEVFVSAFPIRMPGGEVVGCAMILHDIAARKSAERQVLALNAQLEARVLARTQELDETRRLFQAMLDGAPLLIGYWDKGLRNRFANRAYRGWFGCEDASLAGRDILSLLGDELYKANKPRIDEVLRGNPQVFELSLARPNGSGDRHFLMHYQPDSQGGEVRGFFVLASDISELRAANLRLQRSEAFLQTLLDTIPGLILYCRSDLSCEFASSSSSEWLGAAPESLRGRPLSELLDAETYAWYRPLASRVLAGECLHLQRRTKRRDGREAELWVHLLPDPRPGGAGGFLVVLNDVTGLSAQRPLSAEARVPEAEVELPDRLNHDLRTPLSAVLGYCHLLERNPLPATALDWVLRIDHSARHLLGIVTDLFGLSPEPHPPQLENAAFRLADLFEQLAALLSPELGERPVELVIGEVPEEAEFLVGDSRHLLQVLLNLGRNAIRFTPRGSVVFTVRTLGHDPSVSRLNLLFSVSDTGVGIAAARLDSIFTAFDGGQDQGRGQGLAICRELVEQMGGQIRVRSEEGSGSEFNVELGFGLHRPESPSPVSMQDLKVLIAEDHPVALQALCSIVAGFGWRFDAVRDGAAAIELLEREGFSTYQLCLLDWHMPQFDGLTVARHLRELAGADAAAVVLMASAHEHALIETEVKAGLADGLLLKPVTESALYDIALRLRRSRTETALPAAPRLPRLLGVRVLIVDDNEINRDVARAILDEEGALVTLAADGAAALDLLEAGAGGFDAVLMDVRMPGMDGYQVTRRIKADPRFASLPVIALTAEAFASHRVKAARCGMQGFIPKPFDVEELIGTLLKLLPARGDAASGQGDAASGEVDLARGLRTFGSDERFRRYLTLFFEDFQRDALDGARERAELQALAHRMKSAAGFLGLVGLQLAAGQIEAALRAGEPGQMALQRWQYAFDKARSWADSFLGRQPQAESASAAGVAGPDERLSRLRNMQKVLEQDDLDGAEALLDDLEAYLDRAEQRALRQCLERFDLPGALSRISELIRRTEAERDGEHA